jgi:hypothetical protein
MLQEEIRAKEPQPAQVMRVLQAFDAFLALEVHSLLSFSDQNAHSLSLII